MNTIEKSLLLKLVYYAPPSGHILQSVFFLIRNDLHLLPGQRQDLISSNPFH